MVTLLAYGFPPPVRRMPARTAFFCSSIGSPPHTRGKSTLPPDGNLSLRSTPHMRGTVLFCVIPVGMPPHGSPPPVRGKGGRVTFTLILSGSTPAYARKRSATKPRRTKRTDHPRPCGEKLSTKDFIAPPSGSPRACGKKWKIKCANTRRKGSPPRMRGKGDGQLHCQAELRITPRVRGKGIFDIVQSVDVRITPACAGKSLARHTIRFG